uniref:Uncharacterized protein n=1 Tax=Panagrolaimus sp. PS1159 TaxID=55785 RepID=A0AC35F0L2_9BILA
MNVNESVQVSFQQFFCSPDPLHLPQHQQQPPTSSTFFNNDNSNTWHQPSFSSSSSFNHNRSYLSLNYNQTYTSYSYNNTPPFAPPNLRSYAVEYAQNGQQQFYENDFVTMREESILQTITNLNAEYTGMNNFSMCLNRDPNLEPTFSPKRRAVSNNKSSSQFDAIHRKPLVPEPLKRKRPADGSLETLSKPSETKKMASSMTLKYPSSSALSARPYIPDQMLQRSSSSAVTHLRNECPSSGNPHVSSDSWVVSQRQSGASVTDQRPSTSANTHSSSYSGRSNVSDSWNVSQRQLGAPVTSHPYVADQSSQPTYAMNDPRFSSFTCSNVSDSRHVSQKQSTSAIPYPSSASGHPYAFDHV